MSHVAISSPNPQNLLSEPPPLVFWSVAQINAGKAARFLLLTQKLVLLEP